MALHGRRRRRRTREARHPSQVPRGQGPLRIVWPRVDGGIHPTRAARRRVQQLPPVLHGYPEHHRHGRPGRALPEAPGAPGPRPSRGTAAAASVAAPPSRTGPTADPRRVGRFDSGRRARASADAQLRVRRPGAARGGAHARSRCDRRGPAPSGWRDRHRHGEADFGHPQQAVRKWPLVRGLVVLYETLVVGTRWLIRSANVQAEEDDVELGKGSIVVMLLITFVAAIAIFSLLPLFISSVATSNVDNGWAQPVLEGVLQVGIFLGYLVLVESDPGHPPDLPVPRRGAHDDPRPGSRRPADGRRGPQVPDRPPPLRHGVPRRRSSCSASSPSPSSGSSRR